VTIAIRSGKSILLASDKLAEVLAGRQPPPGFTLTSSQALGIMPLESRGRFQGVAIFSCPSRFITDSETTDILAIFARTAGDSLATAREFERSTKMAGIVEQDAHRARILQQRLTSRYQRTGKIVYWAHLQPAGELAGDVLTVRPCGNGCLNVWAADVAGRGTSAGWSMMFIRQLLSELPQDLTHPLVALKTINTVLHDVESQTSPGIFATLVGLHLDEPNNVGRFARAGTPKLLKVDPDGDIESIDPDGMPLGLFPDAGLAEAEFPFKPGDRLVWVSDGMLGVRDENGNSWTEDGLVKCIEEAPYLPARALFEHILEGIGEFAADDMVRDDWSLIVAGFDQEPEWCESMPGRDRNDLAARALKWLDDRGSLKPPDLTAIRVVIDEALTNAHEHGNRYNDDSMIEVKLVRSKHHVHVKVRDEGGRLNEHSTNPSLRPDKILEDKGRGFLLMRHQSDFLWVEEDRGELNAVRLLEAH
jgi:serine phosphatase RsbU (regulator of sigma subunit)/anti-sigma regulatory factor (Ser/Thr protein kinase)